MKAVVNGNGSASVLRGGSRITRGVKTAAVKVRAGFNDFEWQPATVSMARKASGNGEMVDLRLRVGQEVLRGFTTPGQFLQVRAREGQKPAFMAVATPPPGEGEEEGEVGLLVKDVAGTTASEVAGAKEGEGLEVSPVMGPGFPLERLRPAGEVEQVFLVCTGSGIAPIRSLIESGQLEEASRREVVLLYGVRSSEHLPLDQATLDSWRQSKGIRTQLVLSSEGAGYVQDHLHSMKENISPRSGACLCGQKEMVQAVKSVLSEASVPEERQLLNF